MSSVTIPHQPPVSLPGDPDPLYEVVDGVIVETPPMSALSNVIKSNLLTLLGPFVREHNLGRAVTETLFILDAQRNLQRRPDVAFVSAERWPLDREVNWEGDWEVVPDLCVEVISPNDPHDEVTRKIREYFAYGVRQVWVVWPPEREVHVYESREQHTIVPAAGVIRSEAILPGFGLPVSDLFS